MRGRHQYALGATRLLVGLVCLALAAPVHAGAQQASSQSAALVRIPFPQEDGDLTPYGFQLGYPLVMLVYDSLLWRDASGKPQPWLAESVDQAADGRRITLRLAAGVRFHDGAPMTADDVVFSFRYFAAHSHPRFTAELDPVSVVQATDRSTVVIELTRPSPGFIDQPLADMPILPAHLWRDLPAGRRAPDGPPIGTGPYRLTEHQVGQFYRFEANPDYFRGTPSVRTVEVPIVTDAESTLRALETRRVDMIPLSLPPDAAARVKDLGIKEVTGVSYVGTTLTFNLRRSPFDRLEVRQAVAKAIDLKRVADGVGGVIPADRGYVHPDSPWSSPDMRQTADVAAARDTLSRLVLPPVSVLAPNNDPVTIDVARQVVLALQRVGVQAQGETLPVDEVATALGENGAPPDFDLAVSTISPLGSYDADFLRRLFGPQAGALNPSGYRSAAFDELAARVATTADPVARRAAVVAELRLLASDVPALPLVFAIGRYSYRSALYEGWVYVKGTGILDKQSFLAPNPGSTVNSSSTIPAIGPPERASSGDTSSVQWVAFGLAIVAAGMVAFGGLRWAGSRRRVNR